MPALPRPDHGARRAAAVLLAALAALGAVLGGAPSGTAHARVAAGVTSAVRAVAPSPAAVREVRAVASAAVHAGRVTAPRHGPGPVAALTGAVLLAALAVAGAPGGPARRAARRRTPGTHRGRAPPAVV